MVTTSSMVLAYFSASSYLGVFEVGESIMLAPGLAIAGTTSTGTGSDAFPSLPVVSAVILVVIGLGYVSGVFCGTVPG